MVKGDSKYIIVDYEKVVDVFLPAYQSAVVTRDVLRSMLFDENFVVSDAVKADLAGRSPTTTSAELRLAMLQFPLKQFQTENGDFDVISKLYTATGEPQTKLSDLAEMERFKKISRDNSSIALIIAVSEWLNDSDNTLSKYGNIEDWDVSNVSTMKNLFKDASTFNKNLSEWDVTNVTDMTDMFSGATAILNEYPGLEDLPNMTPPLTKEQWQNLWA